jgi:hypothetical protein
MTVRNWIRKLFDRKPRTIRKKLFRFRPRLGKSNSIARLNCGPVRS